MGTVNAILAFCFLADAIPKAHTVEVACPSEAPVVREVQYEEAWRVGGDESAEYIFGRILAVVTDPQGRVYLLDSQLQ